MPHAKRWNAVTPKLGYGAAHLGNLYAAITDAVAEDILKAATAGNAFIDTAPYYGHGLSEQRIGNYLRAHPNRRPMISTKVGRRLVPCDNPSDFGFVDPAPFEPVFDYSGTGVRESLEDSLVRLDLPAVDLLLLHDIGPATHGAAHSDLMAIVERETWPAMQRIKNDRLAGAIGLGVNECGVVLECLDRGIIPDAVMLAGRHTLLDASAERSGLIARCAALGIGLIIAAPFNSGILAGGDRFNYSMAPRPIIEAAKQLSGICADFGVELPAAALQFPLRCSGVSMVVAGAKNSSELHQQSAWINCPIPDACWRAIEAARSGWLS